MRISITNLGIFLILPAFFALTSGLKCGQSPVVSHSRIVGGAEAHQHQFPWLVKVTSTYLPVPLPASGSYMIHTENCGGSLINNHWALSAAHCFPTKPPLEGYQLNKTELLLGAHNLSDPNEFNVLYKVHKVGISHIKTHISKSKCHFV